MTGVTLWDQNRSGFIQKRAWSVQYE